MTEQELFEQIKKVVTTVAKHVIKGEQGWMKVHLEVDFSAKNILNGVSLRDFGVGHRISANHMLDQEEIIAEDKREAIKRSRYKPKKQQNATPQAPTRKRGPGRPKGSLNK